MKSILLVLVMVVAMGFFSDQSSSEKRSTPENSYQAARENMVKRQLTGRDITDPRVLKAMAQVPRHEFVLPQHKSQAYDDNPLSIGLGQTISQPYIVAFMTQSASMQGGERCLEVGTGSGYQAAVLAEICKDVYTIEILCPLADRARQTLKRLGYKNVEVRCGDGYQGWALHAPFDTILVTAAASHVPEPLLRQLAENGKLLMPVGGRYMQEMLRVTRTSKGYQEEKILPVIFVPLTGPLKETVPDRAKPN